MWVRFLGREDPLESTATHSSILAGKNPMDRGAWWVTVHEVAKSQTQLSSEHLKVKVSQSRLTLCDLVSPLSMKFPGKNTVVGSRSLLQGFFPTLVSCTACRVFTI